MGSKPFLPAPASGPALSPIGEPAIPEDVKAFRASPPVKRVQEFYAKEGQRIGTVDPDPALTQKRLALVAKELTEEEVLWLYSEAVNPKASGDGRFFATYMLALSSSPEAVVVLGRLALAPLPPVKNTSLVELERQIRAQAIEGLGRVCATTTAAGDSLLDVVGRHGDEFLRDRAHRALYECRTGKSIEDQDKAALKELIHKK